MTLTYTLMKSIFSFQQKYNSAADGFVNVHVWNSFFKSPFDHLKNIILIIHYQYEVMIIIIDWQKIT